jgi:hypothetical protein
MNLQSKTISPRGRTALALVVIAATVLIVFASATQLNFVGDDWIFLDIVGRLNLHDYLIKYLDPYVQTAWYRPVQGIQYLIGYHLFGSDPFGYHLENVLLHLVNSWLLFGIVNHTTQRERVGLIAALLYATFPIAVEGIFKAGVIDPLLTTFSLLSIWFWLRYLEQGTSRAYGLAFANFILALYCKEISLMLPVILFLIDRLYVAKPAALSELVRRYVWFAAAFVPYVPIEYIVTRRSVFVATEGYAPSVHILSNLIDYLSGLAFPWLLSPPLSYLFLALALALLAFFIVWKKRFALVCLVAVAVLPVLPIAPFPQVSPRFLYFSLTASAFLFALGFDWVWRRLPRAALVRALAFSAVALAVLMGSLAIQDATAAFAEFSRVSRVAFRDIRQAHPTFPNDTLLYFIDPPVPGSNLSGMFFSRYGAGVLVGANDSDQLARLRDHAVAYVYHFNAQGDPIEQRVDKNATVTATPAPPVDFAAPIRLEGWELVNPQVKRGQPIILILYWRALSRIHSDYVVFVHLIDQNGSEVAGYEKYPRGGKSPTSAWMPGQRIVDAIVLPLPGDLPVGSPYQLELKLFDPSSHQPLGIPGADGTTAADRVLVKWIQVLP